MKTYEDEEGKTHHHYETTSEVLEELTTNTSFIWKEPERSGWTLEFCEEFHYTPLKNGEPNRFHRFMQELCFGVKWTKS